MEKPLRALLADESGATAIEYGLLAALVAVGVIFGMDALGNELLEMFAFITTTIQTAVGI